MQIVILGIFYTDLMPFLMYRNNDLVLRPSSYPYIFGMALNQYKINTSLTIYIFLPNPLQWTNQRAVFTGDKYTIMPRAETRPYNTSLFMTRLTMTEIYSVKLIFFYPFLKNWDGIEKK